MEPSNSGTLFEGVFINKLETHSDYRGFFREILRIPVNSNLNSNQIGQISHSEVFPGVVKAWHAHSYQYQWTYIAKGSLLIALVDKREGSFTQDKVYSFVSGDSTQALVYGFPPGVFHGYRNLGDTSQVIYITSGEYDPDDELRLDAESDQINFSWQLKYN